MKNARQSGSAHVVIVIVLVAAIVAALGWIYWQNFVAKDPSSTSPTSSDTVTETPTTDKIVKTTKYGTDLSLAYPSSWKLNRDVKDVGTIDIETITITSPDNSISVELVQTSTGQYGGMCSLGGTNTITHVSKVEVPGFEGVHYYEVVSRRKDETGKYTYTPLTMILKDDANTARAKLNADGCYATNTQGVLQLDADEKNVQGTVRVKSTTLDGSEGEVASVFTDESKIKEVFNGADYKTAVKIVQSLKQN